MSASFSGFLTPHEEFLFPDTPCGNLPSSLRIAMPKNGRPGIQLLLKTSSAQIQARLEGADAEWYCMKAVPVEYNTGDGQEQGGAMVISPDEKPDYAIQKAPFHVFDCLKPSPDGRIEVCNGLAALYFCPVLAPDAVSGEHTVVLYIEADEGVYQCTITLCVYDVHIPQESFQVTNWYCTKSIERLHAVKYGTSEFYDMLRRYADSMRRVRQTMFFVTLDERCIKNREAAEFDFEHLTREIEVFFESGMHTLEIGGLLSRGFLPDGKPDMYTDTFKCALAPDLPIESEKGYYFTTRMVQQLAAFLKKHNWDNRLVVHVHDEPDVHYPNDAALSERRRQYYLAVGILKKYLPNAKVIEAVKTDLFRGGVDIWVPVTEAYEEKKKQFDALTEMGEEVWTYVCCAPEGHWLNRFLDKPVLESRILMWGCEQNRLAGYLHWGFNQFIHLPNPFEATSCGNPTGIGTNFPCGDAFLVYPGDEGPWISMRLEAERRGTEDLELLRLLRTANPQKHDELMEQAFTDNRHFIKDPKAFSELHEQLLQAAAAH